MVLLSFLCLPYLLIVTPSSLILCPISPSVCVLALLNYARVCCFCFFFAPVSSSIFPLPSLSLFSSPHLSLSLSLFPPLLSSCVCVFVRNIFNKPKTKNRKKSERWEEEVEKWENINIFALASPIFFGGSWCVSALFERVGEGGGICQPSAKTWLFQYVPNVHEWKTALSLSPSPRPMIS